MHPGALIADIGHLEKIFVEAHLPNRFLKERLMGARRAGGDHHPVQMMLIDCLFDLLLRILRTGIEVFIHVFHVRQRAGIFLHLGDVNDPADVDSAVTHKDADPGRLPCHVAFRRVLFRPCERPAHLREESGCRLRRRTGLNDRFRNVLGALKDAAGEHAGPGGA